MPRSGSGIYTLPESPFISGTVIRSAPVNSDLSDIANALTQSLATTGVSDMTGPFKAANGSVTAPSITFASNLGTGFYRISADKIGYAVAGVNKATFNDDGTFDFTAIKFANVDVAGNYLDWYEEGTFVPTLEFGGNGAGITYTVQEGVFTRIGNLIYFSVGITLGPGVPVGVGDASVAGLPYPSKKGAVVGFQPFELVFGGDEFSTNLAGIIDQGTSKVDLVGYELGVGSITFDNTNFNNGSAFGVTGVYLAL